MKWLTLLGSLLLAGACADAEPPVAESDLAAAVAVPPCARGIVATAAPRSARGFATSLDGNTIRYQAGPAALPLTPLVGLVVHYRVNQGSLIDASVPLASGRVDVPGLHAGDLVEYYFTQSFAPNTFHPASPGGRPEVDTAWFARVVGAPPPAPPAYPLVLRGAGRFRDRHPNEWRYDHWVGGYQDGASFSFTITDRGNAVDVEIDPAPARQVGKVDLKWYEVFGPTPLCHDPPALAGLAAPGGMARNGNHFTTTIGDLNPGQLVDFELTFTNLPSGQTYYSEWFHYRVGTGRLGRRSQHPWAYAAPDSSAGLISIPQFAFAQHIPGLSAAAFNAFVEGKTIFETDFARETLDNPPTAFDCRAGHLGFQPGPSPLFATPAGAARFRGKLGPLYDATSCSGCHHLDGRGEAPAAMIVRLAPEDPTYGVQLSRRATPGAAAEAEVRVVWETVPGRFGDGAPYTLRRPRLEVVRLAAGPLAAATRLELRVPPAVFGLGLLEAVPEAAVVALADPDDANHDGISGRASRTADGRLGRFGWKASQPTLRAQAAAAFANDMGLTAAELGNATMDAMDAYLRGLAVPPRDNFRDPAAIRGKALFEAARCGACHVPSLTTAGGEAFQAFTDLLLHDLGEGEFRTAPLWGLGYVASVLHEAPDPTQPGVATGPPSFLHDGRAASILEAILWHGGEADAARRAVLAMSAAQRADLVAYVRYPFADPVAVTRCLP